MWFALCRSAARALLAPFGGVRGVHSGRVPRTGALIIAPNHVSNLDPPVVACGCSREMGFMAKEELFRGPFAKLISSLGAFPVRRGEGDTEAVRVAMARLEEGKAVLVFPEGTRGDGVHLGEISKGVALMAKRTGAKVVPVGIVGTHKVLPKGGAPHRAKIRVYYGKPFTYQEVATGANEKENRELFARRLADDIRDLCREGGLELAPPS